MTLGKLLGQGGWAMVPIYLCSVVALAVFSQRFFVFFGAKLNRVDWLEDVLDHVRVGNFRAAIARCQGPAHPAARVLQSATEMALHQPDRVAAEVERAGMQEIGRLEKFLPLLSFIAQVAPLLGLLGTVIGMVQMFYGLQSQGMGNVNASALSSGIWKALLTTAAGLVVSAPTLAGHLYLTSRVNQFRLMLNDAVSRYLTAIAIASKSAKVASQSVKTPQQGNSQGVLSAQQVQNPRRAAPAVQNLPAGPYSGGEGGGRHV